MGLIDKLSQLQPALLSRRASAGSDEIPLSGTAFRGDYELVERDPDPTPEHRVRHPSLPISKYYKKPRYSLAGRDEDSGTALMTPHRATVPEKHDATATAYAAPVANSFGDDKGDVVERSDPFHVTAENKKRFKFFVSSWRFSISLWSSLCVVVLMINTSLTIAVAARNGFEEGVGTLFVGDCETSQHYNTGFHILINILSTCLLAGSNFCMQCLSAPTREEIDEAHAHRIHLDVGVPNLRNFQYMNRRKLILWLLLGLSSLPLHLFYNSVVYASIAFNDYSTVYVDQPFLDRTVKDEDLNITALMGNMAYGRTPPMGDRAANIVELRHQMLTNNLTNLMPRDCIGAYSSSYVTKGNVILVQPQGQNNETFVDYRIVAMGNDASIYLPQNAWLCHEPDTSSPYGFPPCRTKVPNYVKDLATWHPQGHNVDYCLVQDIEQECKVLFSLPVAIIIIVLNSAKALLMFTTAFKMDQDPLLTIGDAFRSFLARPDPWTKYSCLQDASNYHPHMLWSAAAVAWLDKRRRFFAAAGLARWVQAIIPWLIGVVASSFLLVYGILTTTSISLITSAMDAFSLGIGTVHGETVIVSHLPTSGISALLGNIIMANSPQLVLSVMYFSLNALFTVMLTSYEWSLLPLKKKGLRVSAEPQGAQRSTYFLQLPYRYSIPLMAASGLLHWLISQALYLVALERRSLDLAGRREFPAPADAGMPGANEDLYYSCGWSPLAVLLTILLGTFMLGAAVAVGMRKHPTGMPYGATNSLVLAAACHPNKGEESGMEFRKLKWGVVRMPEGEDGAGHCALSAGEVEYPELGKMYH